LSSSVVFYALKTYLLKKKTKHENGGPSKLRVVQSHVLRFHVLCFSASPLLTVNVLDDVWYCMSNNAAVYTQ